MIITHEQLHILQHSLGVDCYGCGRQYRNRYISDSNDDLNTLCGLGLMKDYGPWEVAGGHHFYAVTETGKQAVAEQSPRPPKLTRSQKRYRAFLEADNSMRFGEWLKLKTL